MQGRLVAAAAEFRAIMEDAEADHDWLTSTACLCHLGYILAWLGDADAARAAATAAVERASEFGGLLEGLAYAPLAVADLAAGDVAAAEEASAAAADRLSMQPGLKVTGMNPIAEVALERGDAAAAARFADEAVSVAAGCNRATALVARARVAAAQGETDEAERDARDALAIAGEADAHLATRTPWSAWPDSPVTRSVTVKRHDSTAQPTRSGRIPAQSGSRSTTTGIRRRSPPSVTHWATATLKAHGPRARQCPRWRRSRTPVAAMENVSGRRVAGAR